jgi:hypothetical protein
MYHLLCVLLYFVAFYAFSETNLLTRCHSASSLFSAVFMFQKSFTGNILGIGRNKSQSSYFSRTQDEDRRRAGGGPGGHHTTWWRGWPLGRATPWCAGLGRPLMPPLRLYKAFRRKTLNQSAIFQKKSRSSAAADAGRITTQLGTPRGRYDEHSSKSFPQ